ncbi:MAG: PA0069 family radical SAM protein [Cyclobacteriaceae bacterium]|nr:PA0069 family radical SAM protein [Cyclobacteriaceae bacterium]
MANGGQFKGRGAQFDTPNPYLKASITNEHIEGLDEPLQQNPQTQVFVENSRKVLNKVTSPDLGMEYSLNPYQGCEHGCIYCYARNSHEYYGFSAGLDFESKIIVKKNVASILEKQLLNKGWQPVPIMLSGNTDCYQPLERRLELTRSILKVMVKYRHPISIITKNSLILRDLDLLSDLATDNLVRVMISVTTLDEDLRRKMEPRTATAARRLAVIKQLADARIPVGVMVAPVIPALNHHEIPAILDAASSAGATTAGLTVVRLNGSIGSIFRNWLEHQFPDRMERIWSQIEDMHGGNVHDSVFGRRMAGEGRMAESIHQLFRLSRKKYALDKGFPAYDLSKFHKGCPSLF